MLERFHESPIASRLSPGQASHESAITSYRTGGFPWQIFA